MPTYTNTHTHTQRHMLYICIYKYFFFHLFSLKFFLQFINKTPQIMSDDPSNLNTPFISVKYIYIHKKFERYCNMMNIDTTDNIKFYL